MYKYGVPRVANGALGHWQWAGPALISGNRLLSRVIGMFVLVGKCST